MSPSTAPWRSGTSGSPSTRATTPNTSRKKTSGARSCRRPTATSATRSSTLKPSSTASAPRPPRPSRCSRASRNWKRSSASRFPKKSRSSTSSFRSRRLRAAWWLRPRGWRRATARRRSSSDVRFGIERGDRVALVGVNGAGKSTLIKLLTGVEAPTAGTVKLGHNVVSEYFAQDQYKVLDGDARMLDDISRAALKVPEVELRSLLGCFLFSRRRRLQAARRALRRRAQSLRAGADSGLAFEFSAARRAHQPPRHARQRCAARRARGILGHGDLCLARPLLHRPPGHARSRSRERRDHCRTKATTRTTCAARKRWRRPHREHWPIRSDAARSRVWSRRSRLQLVPKTIPRNGALAPAAVTAPRRQHDRH